MGDLTYRKCALERPLGRFRQRQTTWIPENLAHVGSILQVRMLGDGWDQGWEVMELTLDPPEQFSMVYQREWALVAF